MNPTSHPAMRGGGPSQADGGRGGSPVLHKLLRGRTGIRPPSLASALTARGSQTPTKEIESADPLRRAQRGERLSPDEKWRIRRSEAETTRRRRDRLKGQPHERQHSAAVRRDAGPTAPGEAFDITCARDRHRMAETRHPAFRDLRGSVTPAKAGGVEPDGQSRTRHL